MFFIIYDLANNLKTFLPQSPQTYDIVNTIVLLFFVSIISEIVYIFVWTE